jgi:putative flippase GtrA
MLKGAKEASVNSTVETSPSELKRVGKFGLVGAINTFIDFSLFNLLSSLAGLSLISANLLSTTVAMIFSFIANKQMVFEKKTGSLTRQAATFFLVTAFGLYVIQNGIIALLTQVWLDPVHLGVTVAHLAGLQNDDGFVIKNTAKLIGTLASLTWNYYLYKMVVFK